MNICERCNKEYEITGDWKSKRFCCRKCANVRHHSEETKKKISNSIIKYRNDHPDECKSYSNRSIESIKKSIAKYLENCKQKIMQADYKDLKYDRLKKRLFWEQNGCCNKCHLSEWLGKPISLELEHKDGNHQNNDRNNIELLCPNCHAQTDTYRGKNCRRKHKISDDLLIDTFLECGNIRQTLLKLDMAACGMNYGRIKHALSMRGIKLEDYK